MKHNIVPSYSEELGSIDPSWHPPELNTSFALDMRFESHGSDDSRYALRTKTSLGVDDLSDGDLELAVSSARTVVAQIDGMVRDRVGIPENAPTSIFTSYRVGHGRSGGILSSVTGMALQKLNSPVGVLPPGQPHFDGDYGDEAENSRTNVILCRGGRSTRVYEGPIRRPNITEPETDGVMVNLMSFLGAVFAEGRAGRLTSSLTRDIPYDTAVIITGDTLHRQRAQFYTASNLPVFLRAVVDHPSGM